MTKKATTWMAFYVADYLKKTMHLTTVQHGAYLLLIMACWTEGKPIPADDETLASIVKLTPAGWRGMAPKILRYFVIRDGCITHDRVEEEREIAERNAATSRANGKGGGRPRKTQEKPTGFALGTPAETQSITPSPSPSPGVTPALIGQGGNPPRDTSPSPADGQAPLTREEKRALDDGEARGLQGPGVASLRRRFERFGVEGEPPPLRVVSG